MGPWWDPVKTLRSHCLLLDPVVRGTIIEAVRLGAFQNVAARHAGIKPSTLDQWLMAGRGTSTTADPTGEYREFVQEFEKAIADAVLNNLRLLDDIKKTNGKAAIRAILWHLSKQDPKHYGDRVEITGEVVHRKKYSFLEPPIQVEGRVIDAEGNAGSQDVRRLAEEAGDEQGAGSEDRPVEDGQGTLFGEAPEGEGEGQEEVEDA